MTLSPAPAAADPTNTTQSARRTAAAVDVHHTHHPLTTTCTDALGQENVHKIEHVRHLLASLASVGQGGSVEGLEMIDAIQRLGVDHHFRLEIGAFMKTQYLNRDCGDDLYEATLRFRLLRHQGYHAPSDIFDRFKDVEGNVHGLIELYEASYYDIEGEDILVEARDFSRMRLESKMAELDHAQAEGARSALGLPQHRSLPRFTSKSFLRSSLHGETHKSWMKALREIAEMESSMLQSLHQSEVLHISRWWDNIGLAKEMKSARNQLLKWYMWSMVALEDPVLSKERMDLTKPISLIFIIDDIFDVIGTLDQLVIFTQCVNRWEFSDQLPGYMGICFNALDEITNEISHNVFYKNGWNPLHSLRKTWANLFNAFLVEAKWFASGDYPKAEEYLKNGVVSSGVHVVLIHMFFLLATNITQEKVDHVNAIPDIISSTATILRLWDDLGSAKDENQEGHDGSFIKYYMRENPNISESMARKHVAKMISDAWVHLNTACLSPSPFPKDYKKACLNLARMVPFMYSYDESYFLPLLWENMKPLQI